MPGPQLRSRTELDPEYRVPGLLLPRFGDETATVQQELCQASTAAGVRAGMVRRRGRRLSGAADQPHGATRGMDSGAPTVNAGRLTVALARAAELAGASICPNWPVHKLLRQGSRVTGVSNGSAGRAALARYHAAESLSDPAEHSRGMTNPAAAAGTSPAADAQRPRLSAADGTTGTAGAAYPTRGMCGRRAVG
jgi:hypothetical protein